MDEDEIGAEIVDRKEMIMNRTRKMGWQVMAGCFLLTIAPIVSGIRAPTEPLKDRVEQAETVFVGVVADKVVDGDWVRADLLVEDPLVNAERGAKIKVIWRFQIDGRPIYDTEEGARGIAILGDKHEGRYWLRSDKFEDLAKLPEVKEIIEGE